MNRELLNQLIEKVREIPTRPGNIGGQNYKYVRLEEVIGLLLDALDSYEAKPLPEPDAFIVLDSAGDHVYSSPHKQFCHDHINDLLMRDIGVDDSFVVRGFYAEPPAREPLTDEQIIDLYFDGFSMGELLEFARAIEAAHGIKGRE